ncbi:MAG: (2Fe-2S)-binding protein [Clostridia bacterium]|nr:(2Fe-2S)-binding protein [Clostridia bacterium]
MKDKDLIVCRCEEVTKGEILEAIEQGACSITGIKRRTRAGMGLCQGKTCQKLVERIFAKETGSKPEELLPCTDRPPVRPVSFRVLGGGNDE